MQSKSKFNQSDYEQCCFLFGMLAGQDRASPDKLTQMLTKMKSLLVEPTAKKHVKPRSRKRS